MFYKDVLGFLRNRFPSHLCCKFPSLASIAIVEEELLEKISASILHSKGDKEKSEESVLGVFGFFFLIPFHEYKGIAISCLISVE